MKKDEDKKSVATILFGSTGNYLKKNYPVLILIFLTLIAVVTLCFVKISTMSTVSTFNLGNYEIGQIADQTITAIKTLPADYDNPVIIEKGEKIIKRGFPITEDGWAKLKKIAESPVYVDYRAFANSCVYHIFMCFLFFVFWSRIYFNLKMIELKELITECSFYILVFASVIFGSKSAYLSTPYALCTVIPSSLSVFLIAILFGQLNAAFFSIMISLAVLNASSYQVVPFLYVLATSFSASRLVRKIDRRTDMVFVSVLQGLVNMVILFVFKIIFNDSLLNAPGVFVGVALNGVFSGILGLGLLTPLELLLNTASYFRLMDLSDLNSPTMKKMLVTASGTYNHSLMVASLAESACNEIGANSLLARVGAYYHDIGKMDNPEYFVENQGGGENIHNEIKPSLSVSVIRSHVRRGIEKAHALRLPKQIIDIIAEHHGNQVIAYFYGEAKKLDPNVSPEDYSYTGNPPSTKESAIVMLADTVEAACRTLEKPSVSRLDKFITTLINSKIEHKQLEQCTLTFSDVSKIHDAFLHILAGYYHSRTKYPDQKDPDSSAPVVTLVPAKPADGGSPAAAAQASVPSQAQSQSQNSAAEGEAAREEPVAAESPKAEDQKPKGSSKETSSKEGAAKEKASKTAAKAAKKVAKDSAKEKKNG